MNRLLGSHWLRHPRVTLAIGVIVPILVWGYFIYSRTPPTTILAMPPMASVRAGEEVTFEMPVSRDLSRGCSYTYSRFFVDSTHASRVLQSDLTMTAAGMQAREAKTPGLLRIKILMPPTAVSGDGTIETEGRYVCPRNPTTWIVPIGMSMSWPVRVLPPAAPVVVIVPSPAPGEQK